MTDTIIRPTFANREPEPAPATTYGLTTALVEAVLEATVEARLAEASTGLSGDLHRSLAFLALERIDEIKAALERLLMEPGSAA